MIYTPCSNSCLREYGFEILQKLKSQTGSQIIVPKMGAKAKEHRARALQQAAEISSRNFSRFYTSGAHKSDDHRSYKR